MEFGASVAEVAYVYGVNANQLFKWRRAWERGELTDGSPALLPVQLSSLVEASVAGVQEQVPGGGSICIELAGSVRISVERGADLELVRCVLASVFGDHLPLYRQWEIYARQDVEISRSTMAGWVGAASNLRSPLVDAIQKHVLSGPKLHADDTPLPVLFPGNGKTRTGRLWTYVRDDHPAGIDTPPAVWFAYSEDRKGEHPRQHLSIFQGALQADAYAGFQHLYGKGIYEAACWAHARREFHEIHVLHASPTTTEALARIGALYEIEEELSGKPADLKT